MRPRQASLLALPGLALCAAHVAAQTAGAPAPITAGQASTQSVFDQAFGKRRTRAVQRLALPTTLDGREIGTLDAELGPQGLRMARKPLAEALKRVLRADVHLRLDSADATALIAQPELAALGITAEYSEQRIAVDLTVPLALRAVRAVYLDGRAIEAGDTTEGRVVPAPWSLLVNGRWAASQQVADGATLRRSRLFVEGAARVADWVLEGNGSAATDGTGSGFERYESRLVRDWPDKALRLSLGDVVSSSRPGLSTLALGGLHLGRQFGLNPQLNSQAQPVQSLGLPAGGSVDVVVNGFVVRSLRLDPGVYNLSAIPVFTGANDVVLRVVEPGGRVTEQRNAYFFDASLLAPGLSEWDLAFGAPLQSGAGSRAYTSRRLIGSAWWRQGWAGGLTAGAGLQWRQEAGSNATLMQGDALWASPLGTLAGWAAQSHQHWGSGHAASVQWRASTVPTPAARLSISAAAQLTWSGNGYAPVDADKAGLRSTDAGLRLSAIWAGGWGATLALAQRHVAQPDGRSTNQTATVRKRVGRHWSVEAALARTRSGAAPTVLNGVVALRYSGEAAPDGTSYRASSSWQSHDRRLQADAEASGVTTLAGGEAPWRLAGTRIQAGSGHDTSLRANLLTGRGDASWAVTRVQGVAGASTLHELTLASAVIVSPAGIQVGATVADSAAVLVPRRGFDGLKLVVDPRGERVAASSDRWGPPVLSDLLAYSPRELQLDVENLPPGRGLGIDRPLLLPTYRSVLLVPVGSDANTQLGGRLQGAAGQLLGLQALRLQALGGKAEPIDLFTNRRGGFMSPPLPPGRYVLTRPGEAEPLVRVEIGQDQQGLVDLGTVQVKEEAP